MSNEPVVQESSPHFVGRFGKYPATYRKEEIELLIRWMRHKESGSVVGLPGVGRSTVLNFLCHRPDVLKELWPPDQISPFIMPLDLNILPDYSIATLYRVILRAFDQASHKVTIESTKEKITTLYQQNKGITDSFLLQDAILEILSCFQQDGIQIVWILNHFDQFSEIATVEMMRSLRAFRDNFKQTLSYFVGMVQGITYFSAENLVVFELLDVNECWVGALREPDSKQMILRELKGNQNLTQAEDRIIQLTGGYPMLIRIVCNWLQTNENYKKDNWDAALMRQPMLLRRLKRIWESLTQEEQFALSLLQKGGVRVRDSNATPTNIWEQTEKGLNRLALKGVCLQIGKEWKIISTLISDYVAQVEGRGLGKIWFNKETQELYQGQTPIKKLTNLEREALLFFVKYPRILHANSEIIDATWPDDIQKEGVSSDALYQIIRGIRKKIEPIPSKPVYVINRHGGYQFFSEGRPQI